MGRPLDHAIGLYVEAIRDGNYVEAIEAHAGDTYTQHSTPVKDGKDGFIEFFADFVERNPEREIEIVRAFEDGRYVFLHVLQVLNGGRDRWVTADIFDTDEDGRLIEHWDVIAEFVDQTVSGHSQIDGPTEQTDLDKTEENKALVRSFVTEVLRDGAFDKVTQYVSTETYIQHNPQIADGLEGLQAFTEGLAEQGITMAYTAIHNVVGRGDFVAVLAEMRLGDDAMAVIDLFRVADGRIVEHWDVIEPIPPKEEWVNTGKF